MKDKPRFTFIDLFAGVGGFHQALESLGGECIAFSEINRDCVEVYKNNFPGAEDIGDINKWKEKGLPKFDVLCGGFPCQPFSKAGRQDGFKDERGNFFDVIIDILKEHKECKFIILENVRNLSDKTENWAHIQERLQELDFIVTEEALVLSPCQFGDPRIPQIRERVYILGIRKGIRDKKRLSNGCIHLEELGLQNLPKKGSLRNGDAWNILNSEVVDKKYNLDDKKVKILNIWDEFRKGTKYEPSNVPIWLDYFGYKLDDNEFYKKKDRNGKVYKELPEWKQHFVDKNRKFYLKHKGFIDGWIEKHNMLEEHSVYKKFEWNCGADYKFLKDTIIQFRHSGIRAKRPNFFPALVAINNTPVIWDKSKNLYRYITPREAANLQSFKPDYKFGKNDSQTYKQLGNAVNVEVVKILTEKLLGFAKDDWNKKEDK
ncbi:MAG: DNA cytosine methyltransferase [Firmicutes bacterium]|nr:DNA cytosine methyltransferase [Bacillota bacterium]